MKYNNKYHISNSVVFFYTILGFVISVAIVMPMLQSQYVYPRFVSLLIENTEKDALQTGNHMARTVLKGYTNGKLSITDEIKTYLNGATRDHNLWKVKVFSSSGETIYSTSKNDIGRLNKRSYFHDIVAKGKIFTKVVLKNTKSIEDQIVTSDVVETYIPIMKQGDFIGAFELYYNITVRKDAMDNLVSRTSYFLYVLSFIIIVVVLLSAFVFRQSMRERIRYEKELILIATTDKLTGICNRRRFEEILKWEIKKFNRYQNDGCILLLDIDSFKKVNDTYGHQTGDDVLFSVAQTCKYAIRKSDTFARYGGEEFIVFLPGTDREKAFIAAEKLRQAVESTSIQSNKGDIHVTISIGIAYFKDIDDVSLDSVIKQADDCLYTAKNRGRNQVFCLQKNA